LGFVTWFPHAEQYFTPSSALAGAGFAVVTGGGEGVDELGAIAPPIMTRIPGSIPERMSAMMPETMRPTLCWLGLPRHINQRMVKINAKAVITPNSAVIPTITAINSPRGGDPGGSGGSIEGGIEGRTAITTEKSPVTLASTKKKMSWSTAATRTSVEDVPSSAIIGNLQ
jgi:hypothetical protein